MISFEQAQNLHITELAGMSAMDLMALQAEANRHIDEARSFKNFIDGAIAMKYEEQAQSLRHQMGKDTGSVHFDDGCIRVTAELPKRPGWDQKQLAVMAHRIHEAGDDPAEFIDISYKVSERKYNAWPESLRASFASARTLKTGKPVYRLTTRNEK